MIFFTADTHFGHANIIALSKRPFATVDEMDEALVARWNAAVGPDDTVYHLGDVTLKPARAETLLGRLNGEIHLIWGNHDHERVRTLARWASSSAYREIAIGEERIVLFHYPMREWNGAFRGAYHLWGHCHGTREAFGRSLDIGVDCWDFRPVAFADIKGRLHDLGQLDISFARAGGSIST